MSATIERPTIRFERGTTEREREPEREPQRPTEPTEPLRPPEPPPVTTAEPPRSFNEQVQALYEQLAQGEPTQRWVRDPIGQAAVKALMDRGYSEREAILRLAYNCSGPRSAFIGR